MTARRILFLGGNGTISASCSRVLLERGDDLTHLTRGIGSTRPPIDGVREALGDAEFRDSGFPMTIVRPSHTYDGGSIPLEGGWTTLERMRRGAPVVIHGDGTSLWTLTHSRDFARAFAGLLGNPHALGAPVHITGDEVLTWDAIARLLGDALGVEPDLVHVASETIARVAPDLGPGLLGDKAHSVVFDNTRVKSLVPGWTATIPFAGGAREIVEWHLADERRRRVESDLDAVFDELVALARPA